MRTTVKIQGLKELDAGLAEFKKATARNITRRALTKAAEPMAQKARDLAPVGDTRRAGGLRDSIVISPTLVNPVGKAAFAGAMRAGLSKSQAVAAMRDARRAAGADSLAVIYVGPSKKFGRVGMLQEFGVKPHLIRPRRKNGVGRLSFTVGDYRVMPKFIQHPGHAPHPFMRPAFETEKDGAFDVLRIEMATEIQRAAERARKRALRKKA